MLNTFRVIFVDHDGFVISNPATCGYDQSSTRGYYSIDHGQPTGIAGNYAYDNRSINDWYRKYGTRNPDIPDGGDASLFPPNRSVNERVKLEGKTGGLMASAGMTSPGKDIFGVGGNLLLPQGTPDPDAGNQYSDTDNKGGPEWLYMRKDYGVTLDLRTPSYFFTENGSIRNINKTKAINFDDTTQYDLKFDTNPSSPVQDNEIDLSQDPNDYPKWIYIGLVGAGGPAGARIQTIQDDSFSGACPILVGEASKTIGLCDSWFNNRNLTATGDIGTQIPNFSTYIMSQNYSGLQSAAGQGGRAGIFLKACKAPNNSIGKRRTVVVRLVNLGKGGVETFNNDIRAFNENSDADDGGINKAKTVFPTYDQRKTKVEVYISNENDNTLGDDDKLLTIEVDGGKASIMQVVQVSAECTDQDSGYRESYCADCSGDFEVSGTVGNTDCITATPDKFSNEIYDSSTTDTEPSEDNRAPAFTITEGTYARNNPGHYEWKEAIPFSSCPTDQTDPCGIPSIADPIFPQEFIDQGIIEQSDWFSTAGGIQESLKTVEATLDSNEDFFGLGDDFIFYGNTEYVFEQILDADQFIIIPPLPLNQVIPSVEYFVKDTEGGEYSKVDVEDYEGVDTANTYSVKVVLTFSPNSLFDVFELTNNNPLLPPTFEFEFRRSTDQLLARPGLPGVMKATMVYGGTDLVVGEDDFTEGVGGNGGGVFVGWGDHVNNAAQSSAGLSIEDPWNDFKLVPGSGFGTDIIQPKAISHTDNRLSDDLINSIIYSTGNQTNDYVYKQYEPNDPFYKRIALGYGGDYGPVGDSTAKGYDVAPIARFTEIPESTREGDFFVTLQAYHMEGIHKVTFVMSGGEPIDVYEPVGHPDSLDTNYDKTASGLGKGYREYMVRVDTTNMVNNSVHEIRAIVWPNSGYPLVLQGQKQDSHRFIKNSSTGGLGEEPPQELYKVTPTIYPWVTNKYPEMMGEYNPDQVDVNGVPLTIAPNPDTGGITLIDEPSWYTAANQEQERLDNIGQVPSGVVDTSDMLGWYPPYQNDQIRTWQAVPGEPVDNFEGHVDDLGKPAWWIPGSETNNVGYHGFWFRYQKSGDATVPADTNKYPDEGHRRVLYVDSSVDVNSSGRDTNLLGTIDHPYQSLDEVMDALETGDHPEIATGTYEIEDYFSAKLILLGQKDSPADGQPKGRIYKWWGSDNVIGREFQNCLDHNESRESAQNPSCQVLTVEARKVDSENGIPVPPSVGPPIDFNPTDQESSEIYDKEVVLLSFDGGWGKEFSDDPSDPSKDNGGTPKNANVQYKNFRFITDLPTANTDDMFKVSANVRRSNDWGPRYQDGGLVEHWRFKAPTSIIENCKFNSWSEWGANAQLSYTDKSGLTDNSGKVYWAGPPTPGVAPEGECSRNSCTYDETNHAPLDRSRMRSIDVTLLPGIDGIQSPGVHPVVWEKIGKNMEYIWQGDKFPDPETDIIGPNRQLLDERLPGYDTLLRWSFGNPDEIVEQKAAINNGDEPVDYPDGLYVSIVRDGRGPEGTIPGTKIDLSINTERQWRPLEVTVTNGVVFGEGVPNQRRRTGTLRNDSVFTRALTEGYPGNVDLYSSNCIVSKYGAGRRFVGVNLVKNYVESNCAGDTTARSTSGLVNCVIDIRSISYFPGKRLASNGGNTVHGDIAQIDASDLGWMDNRIIADILMPNNASQLAHMSKAIPRRRNSKYDIWRASHKFRNWAFVNVISDSGQASNTWNLFESFDHLYIRGHRLKATHIRFDSNARHGIPYLGERYDNRVSHLYLADMNSGQVGIETTRTEDGVQGAYNVVDTVSANENYKGYARTEPTEIDGTPGNYVTTPGVFKYAWADEKGRGSDNTGFWPQKENPSYGGANDEDPERDDDKKYFPTAIPANQIYWYPVYNSQDLTTPGNYTVDPNTSSVDDTNFDDILRSSLGQYCDASNSIIRFDTCIYSNWGNGPDKMVQGNIETNFFNQNGVPPIEQAYLIQGDDPTTINHIGRSEAVGAPNGVPTKNKNTFQIEDDNGNLQQLTYIKTYAGNSGELLSMSQGFTAPPGWNAIDPTTPDGFWNDVKIDLIQNVRFVPTADTNISGSEQWPRAGKVVDAHYLYDRETFKDIVANGGWNYTPELDIDYTPHKL